jgi:hypothetical protein
MSGLVQGLNLRPEGEMMKILRYLALLGIFALPFAVAAPAAQAQVSVGIGVGGGYGYGYPEYAAPVCSYGY